MISPCGCDWISPGTSNLCKLLGYASELLEAAKNLLNDTEEILASEMFRDGPKLRTARLLREAIAKIESEKS